MRNLILIMVACISFSAAKAQENIYSMQQAVETALKNSPTIKAASSETEARRQLLKTNFDLPKTDATLLYGQYNGYPRNDNNITISQSIPFFALGSQGKLNRALVSSGQLQEKVTSNDLVLQVKQAWMQLSFLYAQRSLLLQQDSVFEGFYRAAAARYKSGESNLLEQSTADAQRGEIKNRVKLNDSDIAVMRAELKALLSIPTLPDISSKELEELQLTTELDSTIVATNPSLALARQQIDVAHAEKTLQRARFMPDLTLGYFNQTLIGVQNLETGVISTRNDRFTGLQVGLAIPIWFGPHQGRVKAAEFRQKSTEQSFAANRLRLNTQIEQAVQSYSTMRVSLDYYKNNALPNAQVILQQAQVSYRNGEIGYAEYLIGLRNASSIREAYLQTLNRYNQSIIFIEFLSGNKSN